MNKYNALVAQINENSEKNIATKNTEFSLQYIIKIDNEIVKITITTSEDLKKLHSIVNFEVIDIINNTYKMKKRLPNDYFIDDKIMTFILNNFNIKQISKGFMAFDVLFTNYDMYLKMSAKDIITDISNKLHIKRDLIKHYLLRLRVESKKYNQPLTNQIILWLNDYKKYVENK